MPLDSFRSDVSFAARVLRRSPGFTAVAVVTLALGVGGSTALFAIARGALLERWPYDGYDRIVTFRASSPAVARTGFPLWSAAEYRDLLDRRDIFDAVIAGDGRGMTYGTGHSAERIAAGAMTATAWTMLGVRPLRGRTFDEREDRPGGGRVAVVSYRFWRNHLASSEGAVGSVVRLDDTPYTVVGVMPAEFVWWDRDVWVPLQLDDRNQDRRDRRWYVQARLRPGVSIARANAALRSTPARWNAEHRLREYENLTIELLPLVQETLRDVRQILYVLLAAVGLVLIVASANVATLVLIRGVKRRGEIAVRLALGAGAWRVARQLLTESLVLASIAGAAGLWLASWLLDPLVALIPFGIPAEAHIVLDWRAASFAVGVATISGAFFGAVPAFRAVQANVAADLKEATRRTATGASRTLDAFMIAQFSLALVVLSSTMAIVRGFERTLSSPTGFDDANVLTFRVAFPAQAGVARRSGELVDVLRGLARLPGVQAVAAASTVPVGDGPRAPFSPDGGATQMDANVDAITPGYFGALRTAIVDGRDFGEADDARRAPVAIVNEAAAARMWPRGAAVGRRLVWREHAGSAVDLTVVGVAANIRRDGLAPAAPAVFVPAAQEPPAAASVLVRATSADEGLFAAARTAVAAAAPDVPVYAPRTLARLRGDALGSERLAAVLLSAFALVALVLSVVGMYGVTRYIVEQRAGELGVRLALGAAPRDVLRLVLARSVRNLAIGSAIGAVAAWMAVRALETSVAGVSGGAPVFAAAIVPLVAAAIVAAYLPARNAARVSPVDALRAS